MIKFLLTILFFLCVLNDNAQNLYQSIISEGSIPLDFINSSKSKYEKLKNDPKSFYLSRKERLAENQFYLESNFWTDDLNTSGDVVFGTFINNYLQRIADTLMSSHLILQKKIKMYLVKSSYLNAFAVDNGNVYINIGLLAKVKNEAELAFIIAHEISHILNKHGITGYIEAKKIEEGIGAYKDAIYKDKLLIKHAFSREQEIEADENGFDIFFKTEYNLKSVKDAFNLLEHSLFPIYDNDLQPDFFDNKYFIIPKDSLNLNIIQNVTEVEDEEYSTHPTAKKRIEILMKKMTDTLELKGKKMFLISESEFLKMKERIVEEQARNYFNDGLYEKCFFYCYNFIKDGTSNYFFETYAAKSLLRCMVDVNEKVKRFDKMSKYSYGKESSIFNLFNSLYRDELNLLVCSMIFKLNDKYPDSSELKVLKKKSILQLMKGAEEFRGKIMFLSSDELSKKLTNDTISFDTKFARQCIFKWLNEDYFKIFYDQLKDSLNSDLQNRNDWNKLSNEEQNDKWITKNRKGYYLGIDTIVVVNPFGVYKDLRKHENKFNYIKSEDYEYNLINNIKAVVKKFKKKQITLLDSKNMSVSQIDNFNDLSVLNSWLTERLSYKSYDYFSSNTDEVSKLVKKYHTKYYTWTGVIIPRYFNLTGYVSILFAFYQMAPLFVYWTFKKNEHLIYFSVCFDLTTGEMVYSDNHYFRRTPGNDIMKMYLYNTLTNLTQKVK